MNRLSNLVLLAAFAVGAALLAGCGEPAPEKAIPVPGAPLNEKQQALQNGGAANPEPFKERDLGGTVGGPK